VAKPDHGANLSSLTERLKLGTAGSEKLLRLPVTFLKERLRQKVTDKNWLMHP
jgi:hypothetical protein